MQHWRCVLASLPIFGAVGCSTVETRFDGELAACSKNQTAPATESNVEFLNASNSTVGVYCVTVYSGDLKHYFDLRPGEVREQHTFIGHLWVARAKNGAALASHCVAASSKKIVF